MREAIWLTERASIRLEGIDPAFPRIIDAWITERPPVGETYLSAAHVIRRKCPLARVRAKRRRIWWLPWRKGGGRG